MAVAGLAYTQEIVTAFVSHNYIGCRHPEEINRVFADFGTVSKSAHGAVLKMRRCVFLVQGDLVSIIGDAPHSVVDGREQAGYYVAKGAGPTVWFPRQLLSHIASYAPKSSHDPVEAPALHGELPVGRWSVWVVTGVDQYDHEYEIELARSGAGSFLRFHGEDGRPAGGFRFPAMGPYVWTLRGDFAWKWFNQGRSTVPARLVLSGMDVASMAPGSGSYAITVINDALISMAHSTEGGQGSWWPSGLPVIMVRIGSDSYWSLIEFTRCIENGGGSCKAPFRLNKPPVGPVYWK